MIIYVDSQRQLECISPRVGMPSTCTVTRIRYLHVHVPSTYIQCSPAGFLDVLTSDLLAVFCRAA